MVYRVGENSIVYRVIKVEGLPHTVSLVRDPKRGGFTTFMNDYSPAIGDGDTVKGAINSLKVSYKGALAYEKK